MMDKVIITHDGDKVTVTIGEEGHFPVVKLEVDKEISLYNAVYGLLVGCVDLCGTTAADNTLLVRENYELTAALARRKGDAEATPDPPSVLLEDTVKEKIAAKMDELGIDGFYGQYKFNLAHRLSILEAFDEMIRARSAKAAKGES